MTDLYFFNWNISQEYCTTYFVIIYSLLDDCPNIMQIYRKSNTNIITYMIESRLLKALSSVDHRISFVSSYPYL